MGRRVVLLVSAVVVATMGAALVWVYVDRADDRALAGQDPVAVLVAKVQIAAGTSVSDAIRAGSFVTERIPRSAAAAGALSSSEPIRDSVVLTTLFPGQQAVQPMFGRSVAEATTSSLPLPVGTQAMSFQFNDPARVAGFVQPGSRVAVWVSIPQKGDTPAYTQVLLPNAQVVAVGPTTLGQAAGGAAKQVKDSTEEQVPKALLTLALDEKQGAKVVFASQEGQLYLGLLNDKSKVTPGTRADLATLFG